VYVGTVTSEPSPTNVNAKNYAVAIAHQKVDELVTLLSGKYAEVFPCFIDTKSLPLSTCLTEVFCSAFNIVFAARGGRRY
jgi:hypothetical protein